MSRATFTARDPAHMQPVDDGVPYVMTASERSQAVSFTLALERHRRRCNRQNLAVSEAKARGELHRAGILLENDQ